MNGFNFTLAVCPENMNLDTEMQFIKSALLYADTKKDITQNDLYFIIEHKK
jgi:hypothetical protein